MMKQQVGGKRDQRPDQKQNKSQKLSSKHQRCPVQPLLHAETTKANSDEIKTKNWVHSNLGFGLYTAPGGIRAPHLSLSGQASYGDHCYSNAA